MNRFMFSLQEAGDTIFKTGLSKGLTEFFNTSAKAIRDLAPLWRTLGRVIGSVFQGISEIVRAITPALIAIGEVFDGLSKSMGDFSGALVLLSPLLASIFSPAVKAGLIGLTSIFARLVVPIVAMAKAIETVAFWTEELLNIGGNKIGVLWGVEASDRQNCQKKYFILGIRN